MDSEDASSPSAAAAVGAEDGVEEFEDDQSHTSDEEADEHPLAQPICDALFEDPVYAVSAHPTAPIIAAGHGGDGVCAWDARTGAVLLQADKVHTDSVTAVGFSSDGKYLASASLDHTLRVWKVQEVPPSLPPSTADAAASIDGAASSSASTDGAGVECPTGMAGRTTWEIVSGKRKKKRTKKRGAKAKVGGKSGSKEDTASADPEAEAAAATEAYPAPLVLEGPSEDVEWMAWHPSGPALLCGSADCTAWLFDVSSGECISVLAGHEGAVTAGTFDGKGKLAVTGSDDGTLRVWAPGTGECKRVVRGAGWFAAGQPVVSIAAHPSKPLVLAGGVDGTARLVNIATGRVLATLDHADGAGKALEAAATRAAQRQASALESAMSKLAEAEAAGEDGVEIDISGEAEAESEAAASASGHGADASAAAGASAGGSKLAAAAEAAGEGEEQLGGGEGPPSIEGVGFCALEGVQLAATAGSDGSLRVWDLSTMRPRAACKQEGSIVRLAWHPSEPAVVTCSSDGSVRAFDARDGTTLVVLPAHGALCLDMQLAVWQRPAGEPEPVPAAGHEEPTGEPGHEDAEAEDDAASGASDEAAAAAVEVSGEHEAMERLRVPWGEVVVVSGGDDCRIALLELEL